MKRWLTPICLAVALVAANAQFVMAGEPRDPFLPPDWFGSLLHFFGW